MPQGIDDFQHRVDQLREDYEGIINRWCAPQFRHEPTQMQAVRALLEMRACVLDQRRALKGERPIRPLDSYPGEPDPQ